MLVLTRRDGEAVLITLEDGREIRVEIVSGGPCRVAIDAPRSVLVTRPELRDRVS